MSSAHGPFHHLLRPGRGASMFLNPVKPSQRAYVASHPVVFWLTLGIGLVGLLYLFAPHLIDQSAVSLLLPEWQRYAFGACWTAGGFGGFYGIARGKPNVEGAGMSLLATGLAAQFLAAIYVRPSASGTSVFVLTLSIGCAMRAYHLANRGYDR